MHGILLFVVPSFFFFLSSLFFLITLGNLPYQVRKWNRSYGRGVQSRITPTGRYECCLVGVVQHNESESWQRQHACVAS